MIGQIIAKPRRRITAAGTLLLVALYAASLVVFDDNNDGSSNFSEEEAVLSHHDNNERLFRRHLLSTIDESNLMEDVDTASIRDAALNNNSGEDEDEDNAEEKLPTEPLSPYNIIDAIQEANIWESTYALIIYSPESDTFIGHYSEKLNWKTSCKKLWRSMETSVTMLRQTFPERFQGEESEELVIAIASGDYPHVKLAKLPHSDGGAPVLMFGSAFRDSKVYPNMIPMPMPGVHLECFEGWSRMKRVCGGFRDIRDNVPHGEVILWDNFDMKWDDLIPQVIWRGTDFGYLPSLTRPKYTAPINNNHIEKMVIERKSLRVGKQNLMEVATKALREQYDALLPRWKGAVLTAEAELEVQKGQRELPWADIKFSRRMHNGYFPPTIGSEKYKHYDEVGIATGEFMSRPQIAQYKYHIDLGGGGGTTWTGTLEKLAMPGLLFHHVTPTKDYIHDHMQPWKHYIPVAPDLRDLREKFDWAESHPKTAEKISTQGTELMRHLGTPKGFGQMFNEDFVEPLRRVIDAYQPVSSSHPGKTWKQMLESYPEGSRMVPIVECRGLLSYWGSCKPVEGDLLKENQKTGRFVGEIPLFVDA